MTIVSFEKFVEGCKMLSVDEFVDIFFYGKVSEAASHFNVSRQTMHNWMTDEDYEIQVLYCKFPNGKVTHDYILKKQVKRVGAISKSILDRIGYVYAISNGSITKVGCSRNPESRSKAVAKNIGFDSGYELFISNPTDCMRTAENEAHKKLSKHTRENTIYVREVFSCDLETAKIAIEKSIPDISSGPRKTHEYLTIGVNEILGSKL